MGTTAARSAVDGRGRRAASHSTGETAPSLEGDAQEDCDGVDGNAGSGGFVHGE